MASNPPAQCCTVGVKHEGTPQGKLETTGEFESYVARPSGKEHKGVGILFLTDVLGHKLENAQLLADQFAANGYLTVVPDILFGDPIPLNRPEGFNIMNWLQGKAPEGKSPHTPDVAMPVAEKMTAWMKGPGGCKRVGAVGYCYGAKYTVKLLKDKIEAGYVAHPSFVDEEELAAIKGPLSIAAAETDSIFPPEKRHKSEEILMGLSPKQPYQINLYSGVEHGFAVRGDITKPEVKYGMEQAFYQAVAWFDKWLLQ